MKILSGIISGTIGGVVGAHWKDIAHVRSKPKKLQNHLQQRKLQIEGNSIIYRHC